MSMLMGSISKDSIIMASDSRLCIKFEGEYQAINDETEKLFILDDSSMLFGCGSLHVITNLAKHIKRKNIHNIHEIVHLAKKIVNDYMVSGGIAGKNGYVQIFYAQIIDGVPYIHLTSDGIHWEIASQIGEDAPIPFFGGYGGEIAQKEYYRDEEKSQADFISIVRKSFDITSDVHVGGTLKIATLTSEGITTQEFPICDAGKNIKWLDKNKLISKFANALGGSMQLGNTHVTEAMFRTTNERDCWFGSSILDQNSQFLGPLNGAQINLGSINANRIQAGSITAQQIQAGAITAQEIAAGSITAQQIAAGAITALHIAAGAITADRIGAGTFPVGVIYAGNINANQITTGELSADRVRGGTLAGVSVTGSQTGSFQNLDGATIFASNSLRVNLRADFDGAAAFNGARPMWQGQGLATVAPSDRKLKIDIRDAMHDSLGFINALKVKQFRYKPEYAWDDKLQTGFIVQDVKKAAQAYGIDFMGICYDKEADMLSLDLAKLVPDIVQAIQGISKKLDKFEDKLKVA